MLWIYIASLKLYLSKYKIQIELERKQKDGYGNRRFRREVEDFDTKSCWF